MRLHLIQVNKNAGNILNIKCIQHSTLLKDERPGSSQLLLKGVTLALQEKYK